MSDLATSPLPLRTLTRLFLDPVVDMVLFPRPPNQRSSPPRTPRNALHALYRPLNDYSADSAACSAMCWLSWPIRTTPMSAKGRVSKSDLRRIDSIWRGRAHLLSARSRPRRRRGVGSCRIRHVRNSARPSRVHTAAYSWPTTLLPHMNKFQLCSTATTEIRTGLLDQTLDFLRELTATTTSGQLPPSPLAESFPK